MKESVMRKLLSALLMLAMVPAAGADPDPMELLKKVAATYAALPRTTYEFEQVESSEYKSAMHSVSQQRRRIVGSSGKYREESLPHGLLYVVDGSYRWSYNPDRNEYTRNEYPARLLSSRSNSLRTASRVHDFSARKRLISLPARSFAR
jgi:outer membrane lipoprotein-sorting protein